MIIGMGSDLVDIRRIDDLLKNFAEKFENRVFTKLEQEYAKQKKDEKLIASAFAKRFAAKEAFVKAVQTVDGISWLDIEVYNLSNGAPQIRISGTAEKTLNALLPNGSKAKIFVSLSDDYPYAQAQVIISAY